MAGYKNGYNLNLASASDAQFIPSSSKTAFFAASKSFHEFPISLSAASQLAAAISTAADAFSTYTLCSLAIGVDLITALRVIWLIHHKFDLHSIYKAVKSLYLDIRIVFTDGIGCDSHLMFSPCRASAHRTDRACARTGPNAFGSTTTRANSKSLARPVRSSACPRGIGAA